LFHALRKKKLLLRLLLHLLPLLQSPKQRSNLTSITFQNAPELLWRIFISTIAYSVFTIHFSSMSFLIVGLGNIGDEYENTRHNIGFKIADELAKASNALFKLERLAFVAEYRSRGKNVYLIKPTTYMNLSGKALRYWMNELKIQPQNTLVVLDDLAIPFGSIRIRGKGSDGGHNGLKDIDATLGNNNYPRLRFGIGNEFSKGKQVNYVLGKWSVEEMKQLDEKVKQACDAVNSFMFEGIDRAMTKYNKS
jgi:PTH1 family peptidyl-tRNA hydrolase